MALRTIDFSTNITDGTAGGALGDNILIVDGLKIEITASGNWTANFTGGRFNFSEDASVGGQTFSMKITTLDGSLLDFYNYQVTVSGSPPFAYDGGGTGWPSTVAIDNTTWSDSTISGSGLGGDYFRNIFVTPPTRSLSTQVDIYDSNIIGQTYSGTMSFWLDNLTIETNFAPVVSGWNSGDNQFYTAGSNVLLPIDIGTAATVSDADASGWAAGRIRFSMVGRVAGQDALNLVNEGTGAGQIGISGTDVTYGGVIIGTLSGGGTASSSLTVTFNASATAAAIDALLSNVVYSNNTATATGTRTINVTVSDSLGSISTTASTVITLGVPAVAPSLSATAGAPVFTEGGSAVDLFSGVVASTNDSGQSITSLTLTVSNVSNGAAEVLTIGGVAISLTNGNTGSVSGGIFIVSVVSGTATVTLGALSLTNAGAGSLVDGITYSNTSENPTPGTRTVTLTAIADNGASNYSTSLNIAATVTVTAVNDAPVVTPGGGATLYVENAPATAIAPTLTVSDVDDTSLAGATVYISGGFQAGQDVLGFTNNNATLYGSIQGVYNSATGTLTLASLGGPATMAQWQAALAAVTYTNLSDNPNTATRTISFTVSDGDAMSLITTKSVTILAVNDAPSLSGLSLSQTFVEDAGPVAIATGVVISDVDNATLASAAVSITSGFVSGQDVLAFTNNSAALYGNILASYNAATGILALTSAGGTATVAQWQTALAAVTYANTSENPVTQQRGISVSVNDGASNSNTGTVQLSIAPVNDRPSINPGAGSVFYLENSLPTRVADGLILQDPDSARLVSATISITQGFQFGEDRLQFVNNNAAAYGDIVASYSIPLGVLTLTSAGGSTLAQWQSALQAVTYQNTSDNPIGDSRVFVFLGHDGISPSTATIRTLALYPVNDAPVVNAGAGSEYFAEDGLPVAIASGLTISDVDNGTLASASVVVTGNFQSGQDVLNFVNLGAGIHGNITASYDASIGILTLTSAGATASLAQWQSALSAVTYENTSDNPFTATRTIGFFVDDGMDSSLMSSRDVALLAINDAPELTVGTSTPVHTEGGAATAIASDITVSDVDNTTLESAVIAITANFRAGEDVLSFTNTNFSTFGNITASYSVQSGLLSLSSAGQTATVAQWQAALRAITYVNTSDTPFTGDRRIAVSINDGDLNSSVVDWLLGVQAANDRPVVVAAATGLTYAENGGAVAVAPALTVSDVDDTTLTSAEVAITGTFVAAEDTLGFTNTDAGLFGNISASYNAATGVLSLSSAGGTATLAQWQAALRAVTYANSSDNPDAGVRTIAFTVNDGTADSLLSSRDVTIQPQNDAPVITLPGAVTTDVDQALVFGSLGNTISIADADSGASAIEVTVAVTSGSLSLGTTAGLTFLVGDGSADTAMTFSGSRAAINAALDGLTFLPLPNQSGSATLTVLANDQGNSGLGGALQDAETLEITINRPLSEVGYLGGVSPDGTYKIGDTVHVKVVFTGDVLVDTTGGVPTLLLETGAIDRAAVYVAGSGTNELIFAYVVQPGESSSDLNHAGVGALTLNGATIRDIDGQDAILTLPGLLSKPALATQADIVIDGLPPLVTSVGVPANGTYDAGQDLTFTVNLTEAVTVDTSGGTPRIAVTLDTGGLVWAHYMGGSGSSALTFQMTVGAGQRDLTGVSLGNSIQLNGGQIKDLAGNLMVGTLVAVGATAGVKVDSIHNFQPNLSGDRTLTLAEGTTKALTTADLFFTDPDDTPAGVTFTASAFSHGRILVNGVVANSFTGADLAAGRVSFRHDGSEGAVAGFDVFVEDGNEDNTVPVSRHFTVNVTPVNDAPTALTVSPLRQQLAENASTALALAVANLQITDVDGGSNPISLSGADAALFMV